MAGQKNVDLTLTIKAINHVTGPLRKITADLNFLTGPFKKAGADFGAFSKASGLAGTAAGLRDVGGEVLSLGAKFAGVAVAAGAAAFAIVKGGIESGDKLSEMAARVGLSVDAYASLGFAAAQADVDQEQFNSAMDKFNKNLGEAKAGGGPLLDLLKKVSPALAEQVKGAKTTEGALSLMTDAFARLPDTQRRAALSSAAFGKSGLQVGEWLHQGSAEVQKAQLRYLELAGSQQKFADGAGTLDNALRENEVAFLGLRNAALAELFPALTTLSKTLTGFIAKHRDSIAAWASKAAGAITAWVEGGGITRLVDGFTKFGESVGKIIDFLGGFQNTALVVAGFMSTGLIASVVALVPPLVTLGVAIAGVVSELVILAVGAAVAAGPISIAILALAVAAELIREKWGPIKYFFTELWDSIKQGAAGVMEWLKPVIDAASSFGRFMTSPIGADSGRGSLAAGANSSEVRVTVDFANAPEGTRVTADSSNTARVDHSVGYAMGPG